MAIIKDVDTQYGIVSPYHRIHQVTVGQSSLEFLVHGYASQQARENNANPITQQTITVPYNHLDFDPRDIFYPILQTHPWSYLKDGVTHVASGTTPHQPVFVVEVPPPPPMPPMPPLPTPIV